MGATISLRVQKHRTALRESGLRLVQIWVPDRRRSDLAAECRRQSLCLRNDAQEQKIIDELGGFADTEGWV